MSCNSHQPIQLKRDCEAIAIPSGQSFTMEQGTTVNISQSLGGSYTVSSKYGLSRIAFKDQDALGIESQTKADAKKDEAAEPLTEGRVWDALKTVYDPEIPVNIVDLGLVYTMELSPPEEGGQRVNVKMTLTAPGCGMGPVIQADAKGRVEALPGVKEASVELVWEPAWNQDMISEAGRMKLGMI